MSRRRVSSHRLALSAALWVLATLPVAAQPARSEAKEDPASLLGYEIGARFSDYARMSRFIDAVTRDHPRARVSKYGESVEGRDLRLVTISSPGNLARLEEIRERIALLADPRKIPKGADADDAESAAKALVERLPVVVWLSFGVHGDESSSTEAAMKLVWRLLSAADAATEKLLEDTVVIVDPCLNPDGRERYVSWFNSVVGPRGNPDPQAAEHTQPWPGGRYNHWLFDLNRDWAFLTQPETIARVAAYLRFPPQVHVDLHEMFPESSYFFFPADTPINKHLPPSTLRWARVFGDGNARAFDANGWTYYTEEFFDLYYPGYGDSWPSFQGAIGMTYEQGGHGRAGIAYRRQDGSVLTLADRVDRHTTAALATIETAAANREGLLLDFHRLRRDAIEAGRRGTVREFLIVPGRDPGRASELVDRLIRQGIEVRRARRPFVAERLLAYDGRRVDLESMPEGTYLVSPAQPLSGLVMTLLEPETKSDTIEFYDISAWSLPLAFGVDAYVAEREVAVDAELLTAAPAIAGGIEGGRSAVAYVLPWETDHAPRVLARAQAEGFRARVATEAFTLAGREHGRGAVLFFANGNPPSLHDRLHAIASEEGVVLRAAPSALTEKGIDLGSDSVEPLAPPRVAVLTGEGVDATAFGTIHFLLASRYGLDVTALPLRTIGSADLSRYGVLVAPDGSGYGRFVDDAAADRLRAWIRAGGTFVGIEGGAEMACEEGKKIVSVSTAPDEKAAGAPPVVRPRKIEERLDLDRRDAIPGTMLKVDLDSAHPLAFGYPSEIVILKRGDMSFRVPSSGPGHAVGTFLEKKVSGYISPERAAALARRAFLVEVPMGRGRAVLFADDPNFRMFFRGLTRLFLNSIFLLPRPTGY